MPAVLTIRDESLQGEAPHEWSLELLAERVTVRELIRSRVYQEVQDYNLKRTVEPYRGLVRPDATENLLNDRRSRQIDWRPQFDKAVEAFERRQILILLDDRQLESLEEELEFIPGAAVTFLRLTPLVGG